MRMEPPPAYFEDPWLERLKRTLSRELLREAGADRQQAEAGDGEQGIAPGGALFAKVDEVPDELIEGEIVEGSGVQPL